MIDPLPGPGLATAPMPNARFAHVCSRSGPAFRVRAEWHQTAVADRDGYVAQKADELGPLDGAVPENLAKPGFAGAASFSSRGANRLGR